MPFLLIERAQLAALQSNRDAARRDLTRALERTAEGDPDHERAKRGLEALGR
jgi:hypothetical protein